MISTSLRSDPAPLRTSGAGSFASPVGFPYNRVVGGNPKKCNMVAFSNGSPSRREGSAVNAKVTFIFNLSRWGWSETYYWQAGTGGFTEAKADVMKLAAYRLACCSRTVVLDGIRIADLANKGSTQVVGVGNGNAGTTSYDPQEPWLAFLTTLSAVGVSSGLVYRREFLWRGLPNRWNGWNTSAPTAPNLLMDWQTPMENFLRSITNTLAGYTGQWSLLVNNKDITANPYVPVKAVNVVQPGSFWQIDAPLLLGAKIGDKIHIGKAKGYGIGGLIGDAIITAIDPTDLTLYTTSRRQCGPPQQPILTKPAMARATKPLLIPLTGWAPERWVKRDTGRPFAVTVGRRRTRGC